MVTWLYSLQLKTRRVKQGDVRPISQAAGELTIQINRDRNIKWVGHDELHLGLFDAVRASAYPAMS